MNREALDRAFAPRSVAIAGDTPPGLAQLVLQTLLDAGFRGPVQPVGRQLAGTSGRKSYAAVVDIPGPVDYVICCEPAVAVLPLLRDCAEAKVGAVAILATDCSEGSAVPDAEMEREISVLARSSGLGVIGPGCLGLHCPRSGLSFDSRLPTERGRMGLVCLGREASVQILRAAGHRGVGFSKAVSCGNACDINESDLLEYFADDRETDCVALCIDNPRAGRRFLRALRDLSVVKPVMVLKTMPVPASCGPDLEPIDGPDPGQVWNGLLEQTGAVGVSSAEEMVDLMVAFAMLPVPRGRRIGLFGAAGGASVLATDAWASAGFVLPPVPPELKATLDGAALNQAGMILHNPLDFSMAGYTGFFFDVVRQMVAHEAFVDLGIIHNPSGHGAWLPWAAFNGLIDSIAHSVIELHEDLNKPLALVMQYIASRQHWQKVYQDLQLPCSKAGIPVYYTMASAARAIDRMLRYYERKTNGGRGPRI